MGLKEYVVRRLVHLVFTYLAFLTVIFLMFRVLPGDPTTVFVTEGMAQETRDRLIESYGLNEPLYMQYLIYLRDIAQLDLGTSYNYGAPVADILAVYFMNTVFLMGAAFIMAYSIGTIFGALLGWFRGTDFERIGTVVTLMARSSPEFWTSIVLLMIFVFGLGIFPWGGMGGMGERHIGLDRYLSFTFLHHLILPATAAAIFYVATPTLLMRNTMIDVINEDFIEIKKAEGLSTTRILFKHAARNSILPVVTIASIVVGLAIGGSLVVEVVFNWPGMGREMVRAIQARDYPMAQGAFIIMGSVVIFMNFVADLAYVYLDPRVQYD